MYPIQALKAAATYAMFLFFVALASLFAPVFWLYFFLAAAGCTIDVWLTFWGRSNRKQTRKNP